MYVYSRSYHSYSDYGRTLKKIKRMQEQLQRKVDRAEAKLERDKANEVKRNIVTLPGMPQSTTRMMSDLLGDLMFKPGGAASGTFVDIIAHGSKAFGGGTGTYLDMIGSGDTGGVGTLDVLGNTGGGNLINILTGVTSSSIVQATAVSEKIVDPLTRKARTIIAMNKLGSALDVSA